MRKHLSTILIRFRPSIGVPEPEEKDEDSNDDKDEYDVYEIEHEPEEAWDADETA